MVQEHPKTDEHSTAEPNHSLKKSPPSSFAKIYTRELDDTAGSNALAMNQMTRSMLGKLKHTYKIIKLVRVSKLNFY